MFGKISLASRKTSEYVRSKSELSPLHCCSGQFTAREPDNRWRDQQPDFWPLEHTNVRNTDSLVSKALRKDCRDTDLEPLPRPRTPFISDSAAWTRAFKLLRSSNLQLTSSNASHGSFHDNGDQSSQYMSLLLSVNEMAYCRVCMESRTWRASDSG